MNEQTAKLLEDLAIKLGTKADHLWAVLIRQAYVSLWFNVLIILGSLIFSYFAFSYAKKLIKMGKSKPDYGDSPPYFIGALLLAMAGIIGIVTSLLNLQDLITKIGNPEFWALEEILNSFGGGRK